MPLYDYKCANGHIFEVVQSWSADPGATCGDCGEAAKRQVSVPMVVYKGSGFYTTDYGRNESSNGSSSDSESKSNGEKKSASKDSDSSNSSTSSKKKEPAAKSD